MLLPRGQWPEAAAAEEDETARPAGLAAGHLPAPVPAAHGAEFPVSCPMASSFFRLAMVSGPVRCRS